MTTDARVVEGEPSAIPMLLKAALPAVPVVNQLPFVRRTAKELPDLTFTRHDVAVDRKRVAAYSEVCGFPLKEALPITYPHMLAFPLHLAILTDGRFPFPAIGTLHLENAITQHRAISPDERLQVTARPENLRLHPKGRIFDIAVDVHSAGELVWQSTSTLLRPGGGDKEATGTSRSFEKVPPSATTWKVSGDLGRRYAAVSGDHNPIHLYGLTAKAFGFPRQIAHGMWSKARCLAALDGRLPDAVQVEVGFKKPILLPGRVVFGSSRDGDRYQFSLSDPRSGAPHLVGRTSPF